MPPVETQRFDPDGLMRQYRAHMQIVGLARDQEDEPSAVADVPVVLEQRPAVDHGYFSMDPRTFGVPGQKPRLHCVYTRALHDVMIEKGFVPCTCTFHDRDITALPDAIPLAGRVAEMEVDEVDLDVVRIPDREPAMSRKKTGPTAASEIVGWMEQVVQVDGIKYSPMKEWSIDVRAENFATDHPQFYKRCLAYVFVRSLEPPPHQILLGYSDLRTQASDAVDQRTLVVPQWVKCWRLRSVLI